MILQFFYIYFIFYFLLINSFKEVFLLYMENINNKTTVLNYTIPIGKNKGRTIFQMLFQRGDIKYL